MLAHLDESGTFEYAGELTAVGAVVVGAPLMDRALRAALRRSRPGWPWPLHAAHLRREVSMVLASAAARSIDPTTSSPIDADADEALAALRQQDAAHVDAALEEMAAGRLPSFGVVASLNLSLRKAVRSNRLDAGVLTRLRLARDAWVTAMTRTAAALPSAWGAAAIAGATADVGREYLRRAGLRNGDPTNPTSTQRYFGLLGEAFAHLVDVAGMRASAIPDASGTRGPGRTEFRVAARWVHDVRGLSPEDLEHVWRLYVGDDDKTPPTLRVVRYNRDAPALLVLADFVANAVRRTVLAGHEPLESALSAATGLAFTTVSPEGHVSHLARVDGGRP